MNQCPPGPQVFHWSHFEFFRKFAEIFANYFFYFFNFLIFYLFFIFFYFFIVQWCQRHRRKIYCRCCWHRRLIFVTDFKRSPVSLIPVNNLSPVTTTPAITFVAGDNNTGGNFVAGDNDTGEQLSPVTTTPAINLLPVTRTRTPLRWGAAKERRKLKGINRPNLRPPKSATAADGVIGTAMKSCIQKHPTHLDQRPLRPTKLNNAILVWSSFGGLRGLWSGFVRWLCAFSWLFQWQYRRPWPTSAAGESFAARADLCHQYSLSPVSTTPAITFFPGVVDTGQK